MTEINSPYITGYYKSLRHATARISINGQDLTGNPPQHLVSFNYKKTINNAANRAEIVLFDESEINIEKLIVEGGGGTTGEINREIEFSYGYAGGKFTGNLKGIIMDYTPTFEVGGVTLSIETLSAIGKPAPERSETHTGLISSIVQNIAIRNNWDHEIDKTKSVMFAEDSEVSGYTDGVWHQVNQTDMRFVKETLLPHAVNEDGVGDYRLYFNDHTNTLHFHPSRITNRAAREYVWRGRSNNSEVIEFTPSIQGRLLGIFGASGIDAPTVDPITGERISDPVMDVNTENKNLFGQFLNFVGLDDEYVTRYLFPSSSSSQSRNFSSHVFNTMFSQVYSAELKVLGDPFVQAGDIISIIVYLKEDAGIHYTSGLYLVMDATDDITGGEMTTTMNLIKNGARKFENSYKLEGHYPPTGYAG